MAKIDFFLGVDGGASKTWATLIDNSKNILGKGQTKGSNAKEIGFPSAKKNIEKSIKIAFGSRKPPQLTACLALAGVDTAYDQKIWLDQIKSDPFFSQILTEPPLILNDSRAALRAGTTEKDALVVIAGTGSHCYGKNSQGGQARSSGLGKILSDQGSAYAIGTSILKAVVKSLDGRAPKTLLTDLIFEKFNIKTIEELYLLVSKNSWGKIEIAKIANLAEIAAEKGDKQALQILYDAAYELALMVKAVSEKLGLVKRDYTVVTTGSVLLKNKTVKEKFREEVLKLSPLAKFVTPKIDSAEAAALLAMEGANS